MLERRQSLLHYCHNIASLQDWNSIDHGSHTPLQDEGDELMMDLVTAMHTRYEYRDLTWSRKTREQKQTVVNVDREHRDGCTN